MMQTPFDIAPRTARALDAEDKCLLNEALQDSPIQAAADRANRAVDLLGMFVIGLIFGIAATMAVYQGAVS